ncbi:MAG: hypothetical protein BGO95_10705 [Micrococcales bacterium 73-13]|nr:MAG: hypothetical protein BGO95_10705 [Micrococcales bacterium 73-13]
MTTITFPSPVASTTGRTLSSTITAQELGDGTRIELQVDTSHSKGSGYRSHLVRQHADGPIRSMAFTFGADSDSRPLPVAEDAPAPGARFSRGVLARLHDEAVATVAARLDEWLVWAADCTAARR